MNNYLDAKLIDFIPEYLRKDKKIIAICEGLDKVRKELDKEILKVNIYEKLIKETISDEEIELLLWENHVDFFDKTLTREEKIGFIKNSFKTHLNKGTKASITKNLNLILKEYDLLEWFEYGGTPYCFKLILKGFTPSIEMQNKIKSIIETNKNIRSKYEGLSVNFEIKSNIKTKILESEYTLSKYAINEKLSFDNLFFAFPEVNTRYDTYNYEENIEEINSNEDLTYKTKLFIHDSGTNQPYEFSEKLSFDNLFISFPEVNGRYDIYKYEEEN